MDQVDFKASFDDSDVERGLKNMISSVQRGEDAFQDLERTADKVMGNVAKDAINTGEAIENATVKIGQFGASINKNTKQIELNTRAAGNLAFQLQDVFVQLGSGQGIIRTLIQQGPQITSIFGGVGNTFRFAGQQAAKLAKRIFTLRGGIKALLSSTGILLALSIVSYFTQFGQAADFVNEKLSQLTQIIKTVVDRFANIGGAIVNLIKGQGSLNDVWEAGKTAVSGLGDAIADAAEKGERLFKIEKALTEQTLALTISQIEYQKQAELARLAAEDENKTITQRIGLIRQAADLERKARETEIDLLKQKVLLFVQQGKSQEDIIGLQQEISQLTADNDIAAVETAQEINGLIQDRIERTQELTRTLREANATLGGSAETAKAQYEAATEAIQQLREEARLLGLDLDFGPLETIAKAQFERATDAALGELQRLPDEVDKILSNTVFLGRGADLVEEGRQAGARLGAAYAEGVTISSEPILEELRLAIQKAFNINDDQLNNLIGNLGTTYQGLTDGILANTERQITAQDRLIQAIQNRVNETTRLLQIEQQRAADGYANNVGRYEQQLEEQIKIQEEAEQKRLQLEQKAARQRLIINAAEQTSNLVLAAAKLTAAEAGKGIIGIGLALAGLATIFSIVSQAKAQAEQFKELPKFRTGTPYVDGPGTTQSDSIIARLSVGERVMSARDNAALGGRSMTNKEVIELFQLGRAFRDKMQFTAPDFSASIAKMSADRERIAQANAERQMKVMRETYRDAADRAADKMIEYWKTRPVEWVGPNGEKMIERNEGGKIERKIIKQK